MKQQEDRNNSEKNLFHGARILDQMFSEVKDFAVNMIDSKGNIISWNAGAERITGYRTDEIIGKHISIFYSEEDIADSKPQQALITALRENRYEDEGWRLRKDGSRFWAGVTIKPFYDEDGVHQGFTRITRDLTGIRQSEEKFRWILESAPDAVVIVNFEGKIKVVNAQTEVLFGYPRDEILEKEVEFLIPDRFVAKHHHHRRSYNVDPKVRAMGVGLELFGKRKNGEEFPVEVSLSPVDIPGEGKLVFAAVRDITIQKAAQREIKELNEQLDKRIAERTAELENSLANEKKALHQASINQQKLILLSKVSEILASSLDYNRTLSELAGFVTPTIADWCIIHEVKEDETVKPVIISHTDPKKINLGFELSQKFPYDPVVHKGIYKVLRTRQPEFIPIVPAMLLKSVAKKSEQYEIIQELEINSVISVPLIVREKVYGMMTLLLEGSGKIFDEHDLVMAKEIARRAALAIDNGRLYTQSQELNKELESRVAARTAELEAINKELESFSYSVSHDLRAPLRSIDGFSNLILKKYAHQLDPEGQDFFRRVMNATQQMGHLIDDLLKLARLTRIEMNMEIINLSEMAKSIIDELRSSQPDRRVEVDIQPGMTAHADKNLMHAALNNLLDNAWKYTKNNDVTRITFARTVRDGNRIYFVKDNGVGFEMKYVNKLFGAFQRLHSSSEFEGTGIGLATVQRIIRRHKGEIWAESEIGSGATFYFTL